MVTFQYCVSSFSLLEYQYWWVPIILKWYPIYQSSWSNWLLHYAQLRECTIEWEVCSTTVHQFGGYNDNIVDFGGYNLDQSTLHLPAVQWLFVSVVWLELLFVDFLKTNCELYGYQLGSVFILSSVWCQIYLYL